MCIRCHVCLLVEYVGLCSCPVYSISCRDFQSVYKKDCLTSLSLLDLCVIHTFINSMAASVFASSLLSPTMQTSGQYYGKLTTFCYSFFSFPFLSLLSLPVLSSLSSFDRMLSGYSSLPQHERPSLG